MGLYDWWISYVLYTLSLLFQACLVIFSSGHTLLIHLRKFRLYSLLPIGLEDEFFGVFHRVIWILILKQVLPEKFAAHMTTHVPDIVSLIGPSGTMWEVETQKTDNLLLVGDGWKNFVKTYELEENCLLMFKYKRNSRFEVLIFDQESFCEKESCYFVKKCRHTKSEHENHKKRSVREVQALR